MSFDKSINTELLNWNFLSSKIATFLPLIVLSVFNQSIIIIIIVIFIIWYDACLKTQHLGLTHLLE